LPPKRKISGFGAELAGATKTIYALGCRQWEWLRREFEDGYAGECKLDLQRHRLKRTALEDRGLEMPRRAGVATTVQGGPIAGSSNSFSPGTFELMPFKIQFTPAGAADSATPVAEITGVGLTA
jgi:hypothetical protein